MTQVVPIGNRHMPAVGLGLWKISKQDTADRVYDAIALGYRHLDSAADYGNEIEVGQGISRALAEGICSREELWVTSKLWNTSHRREHVEKACRKTLSDLALDYLDLYLIHFPIALKYVPVEKHYPPEWTFDPHSENPIMELEKVPLSETWAAMESLVDLALVREIGVCNYSSALIHDLMSYCKIKPSMLQVELHPFLTQENLLRTAMDYGIAVTGFSPLGALSYIDLNMATGEESVLAHSVVKVVSERTGATPAQVVLRWGLQRGCAIIPKSSKRERLIENIELSNFVLTESEMDSISALNKNRRFNDPALFCEGAFNRFHSIYD
ncbi:aldo/keto reductase [Gammaproteobacteria bacterium]|nr:aldo/keto reductase [Gammaproteobacteria bacterium]